MLTKCSNRVSEVTYRIFSILHTLALNFYSWTYPFGLVISDFDRVTCKEIVGGALDTDLYCLVTSAVEVAVVSFE